MLKLERIDDCPFEGVVGTRSSRIPPAGWSSLRKRDNTSNQTIINTSEKNKKLSMDEIIHQGEEDFAILERFECSFGLESRKDGVKLWNRGIITKIILEDFPACYKYMLSVNGGHIDSTVIQDGKCTFDFSKREKSARLEQFISLLVDEDEPNIIDRNHYVNFYKANLIQIYCSNSKIIYPPYMHIKLVGYFEENGEWIRREELWRVFTQNVISIYLTWPTQSVILTQKYNTSPNKFYFCCYKNGDVLFSGPHVIVNQTVLTFDNMAHLFQGKINNHLSQLQNDTTINFSGSTCYIIFEKDIDVKNLSVASLSYAIKNFENISYMYVS